MQDLILSPLDVLEFWWDAGESKWFSGGETFDRSCRDLFLGTVEAGLNGDLEDWFGTAHGTLALILVLDQLTRNVFRGEARAFAGDPTAQILADHAVLEGYDRAFPKNVRGFFYLPFEHAENMALQERSVDLFRRLGSQEHSYYALLHMDVIRRFGRFPHRNKVLGRATTPDEAAYLADNGFSA
ncbi:DUF924 family protein [Roseibium sp. RKSG952]|uniref:DUF924 family protein n=1 Tax=Roseibium sp. RKSG952 TaxID=2529384 RepID=UPI0012BC77F6|nr:DUF924 family protein [Roseibium sp. RKSG952]MTH98218.1 DUF924 domain-containing protein [Roseibium sp. RKSG952]